MGLRDRFRRKTTTVTPAAATRGDDSVEPEATVSTDRDAELQEAWADLEEAAKVTKLMNFQACTRNGKDWRKDPEAVRTVAGLLRKHGASDDPAK